MKKMVGLFFVARNGWDVSYYYTVAPARLIRKLDDKKITALLQNIVAGEITTIIVSDKFTVNLLDFKKIDFPLEASNNL